MAHRLLRQLYRNPRQRLVYFYNTSQNEPNTIHGLDDFAKNSLKAGQTSFFEVINADLTEWILS